MRQFARKTVGRKIRRVEAARRAAAAGGEPCLNEVPIWVYVSDSSLSQEREKLNPLGLLRISQAIALKQLSLSLNAQSLLNLAEGSKTKS